MKIIIKIFFCFILFGCASQPENVQIVDPDWYLMPKNDSNEYIYSVASNNQLSEARKKAISNINEKLWTQVQSSYSMKESFSESNDKTDFSRNIDNNIDTKTAELTINGIEYTRVEQKGDKYFVEARIKKQTLINQLERELEQYNRNAKTTLNTLNKSDALLWWVENLSAYNDTLQIKNDAIVRIAMLSGLSSNKNYKTLQIDELLAKLANHTDSIRVYIKPIGSSKVVPFLSEAFTKNRISTSNKNNNKVTHIVELSPEYRHSIMREAYISTLVLDIKLLNNKSRIIASNEFVASGNSMTSRAMSEEASERHLRKQIDDNGLWQSLGLKK